MSVTEARQTILRLLEKAQNGCREPLQGAHLTDDGFAFDDANEFGYRNGSVPRTYHFDEMPQQMRVTPGCVALGGGTYPLIWDNPEDSQRFVDAWEAIKYYSANRRQPDDTAAFADFQAKAEAWRVLPNKPPLPEEVQKYRLLAEDAFHDKNFEDAIGYYEKGLAIEPLWPAGQFNSALLCAELKMYGPAARHMKRYLALQPDAKDAEAWREKITVWEAK